MKSHHTPGPWLKDLSKRNSLGRPQTTIFHNPVGNVQNIICNVFGKSLEEAEANARLIAAAPTMKTEMNRYLPVLEALFKEPDLWERFTQGTGIATLNGYKNAIAKATGEKGAVNE